MYCKHILKVRQKRVVLSISIHECAIEKENVPTEQKKRRLSLSLKRKNIVLEVYQRQTWRKWPNSRWQKTPRRQASRQWKTWETGLKITTGGIQVSFAHQTFSLRSVYGCYYIICSRSARVSYTIMHWTLFSGGFKEVRMSFWESKGSHLRILTGTSENYNKAVLQDSSK